VRALSGSGDLTGALRAADAAVAATRGMAVIEFQCLAARPRAVPARPPHAEALSLAREQLAMANGWTRPRSAGPGPATTPG
jgi:hypothetical protein